MLSVYDEFDQTVICKDTQASTRFECETFAADKATIDRLGMAGAG